MDEYLGDLRLVDLVFANQQLVPQIRTRLEDLREFISDVGAKRSFVMRVFKQLLDIGVFSLNEQGNYRIKSSLFPKWDFMPTFEGNRVYVVNRSDAERICGLQRGLSVELIGEYAIPLEMSSSDWMVFRKKTFFDGGREAYKVLAARGIVDVSKKPAFCIYYRSESEGATQINPILSYDKAYFIDKTNAHRLAQGLNVLLENASTKGSAEVREES